MLISFKKIGFLVGRHARVVIIGDFRFGEIYDYVEEGIEATGDYDNGECGIIIRDIDYAKSGDWKCEITRKNRPGSGRIGSEATSSLFRVDVFRTSRLNDDRELLLQVILRIMTLHIKIHFFLVLWIPDLQLRVQN